MIFLLLTAVSLPPAKPDEFAPIVVVGVRDPYHVTSKQLRAAKVAYDLNRARFAPNAPLRFQVFRYQIDPKLRDVRFRVVADDAEPIPVNVDDQGFLALPPLDGTKAKWRLEANRTAGSVRIRPVVLSPGSTELDRRLGDDRLLCAIIWGMGRSEIPFALKGFAALVGDACSRAKFGVYDGLLQGEIVSAKVVEGTRIVPVSVSGTLKSYRMPGYDKSLSNEARLKLTYR